MLSWFCHTSTWIHHGCTFTSFLKDMSLCLERVRKIGTDSFYLSLFWLVVKLRNFFGVQMFHVISKTMAEVGSIKWKFIKLYYYYKWKYFVKLEKKITRNSAYDVTTGAELQDGTVQVSYHIWRFFYLWGTLNL